MPAVPNTTANCGRSRTPRSVDHALTSIIGGFTQLALVWVALCTLLSVTPSLAADWYVDSNVVISGNGQSWTGAWKRFADITWASIKPGDTIWVSGGTYNEDIRVRASGSSGNPILLKASQVPGHNAKIIINGTMGAYGDNYITFDGARSDAQFPRTTFQVKAFVPQNTNWKVRGFVFGTPGGGNGITIRWMEIGDYSNGALYNNIPANTYGIMWNNGDGWGNVVEYNYLHDTEDVGIEIFQNNDNSKFGDWTVRWNYLYHTGNDFIEGQPGMDIHHNYFDYEIQRHGHPDGLAGPMGRTRFYNNILVDVWDQIVYLKIWEKFPNNHGDVYIYGNLIFMDKRADTIKKDGVQVAISLGWETGRSNVPTENTLANVVIAHNTVVAAGTLTPGDIRNMVDLVNPYAPRVNGTQSNTVHIRNMKVVNNIFYNSPTNGLNLKGGEGSGFEYGDSDLSVENNLIASSVSAGQQIWYRSLLPYANAEAFGNATMFKSNSSSVPSFKDPILLDYQLSSADTTAIDRGQNLSALGLPGLETDLLGNTRGDGKSWDIGALEFISGQTIAEPSPPAALHIDLGD